MTGAGALRLTSRVFRNETPLRALLGGPAPLVRAKVAMRLTALDMVR